ncbi:hypothetical protein [Noviherbaspirillum malthae]|jgi:hypothetical protein|uniref:hypothetical protein n=1 Tax=Noviherbaspirillum malthae TaxID=1260987 RepID=UPI00188FFEBE|nr:hypothetical protein [Noviherbaspirillum malthae]
MKIFFPTLVSITCLALNSVTVQAAPSEREEESGLQGASISERVLTPALQDKSSYKLGLDREAPGFYFDAKKPGVSELMNERSLWSDTAPLRLATWLDGINVGDQSFMLGYRWKRLSIEGTTLQPVQRVGENAAQQQGSATRSNWRSTRLAFNPSENWQIKLSRGAVSNLDNLVPGEQVRRTALAATYNLPFNGGDWEATFAWGRNARKDRESQSGYLLESTVRLAGVHSLFGRIEQVGSDNLMRENESMQRQLFKLNRVTFGYFQDLRVSGPVGIDVGAFVSRHLVPSDMAASYGRDPTAYMMFLRLKLQ